MNEWTVVTALIAIVGLGAAVVTPIVKLNSNITRMNVVLEHITREHDQDMRDNTESHRRLWEHNTKQDGRLSDHDGRIIALERRKEDSR